MNLPTPQNQAEKQADQVRSALLSILQPSELITHAKHVQTSLIDNRNSLVRLEVDERFLQQQVHKQEVGTKTDLETALGNVQSRIKKIKATIKFLEEVESEYAKAE